MNTKRASAKRSLTAYKFLTKFDPNNDIFILEKRFRDIEEIRKKFLVYQDELEDLVVESEELLAYRTNFEQAYFAVYGIATFSSILGKRCNSRAFCRC